MRGLGGDIQKSLDAMDQIPRSSSCRCSIPISKARWSWMTAYEHGGWAAVKRLYKHPPESTEQVLHPETKLFPTRELPHKVSLAESKAAGATSDVLGELSWQIYFSQWKVAAGQRGSGGLAGDRYVVSASKDGHLIGQIATLWDSEADAQHHDCVRRERGRAVPGTDVHDPAAGIARPDGGKVFVRRNGEKVFIVDGASDGHALDALARSAKFN